MNKNDKLTLATFFILIFLILGIFIYNIKQNKELEDVDRKVSHIYNDLTFDDVYNIGTNLIFKAIDLFNNDKLFYYETNDDGKVKYYSIKDYDEYIKMKNFDLINGILKGDEIEKYMNYYNIIYNEGNYYAKKAIKKIPNNYVGSYLNISSYNDKYIYFNSVNYYCDNYEYIGLLDSVPNCNYIKKEETISIILENNQFKINNINEIINVLK